MRSDVSETVQELRSAYADNLCILAHHYQDDSLVAHADLVGDSLELARRIPELRAEYIVLCGVYFMAETAAILARPGQKVFIAAAEAGCPLADMAPPEAVERVLADLNAGPARVAPLAYVNSSAAVKAVCGRYDGTVCTSANAVPMLNWLLERSEAVLFLPDANLGANSADRLHIPPGSRRLLDLEHGRAAEKGVLLHLWPGYCHVHQNIRPEHIEAIRSMRPEVKVMVHPECPPEVVALADATGSTSQIITSVRNAPTNSCIAIGTEGHLVRRLARQYAGEKEILPVCQAECPDMAAVTEESLADLLEGLPERHPVTVDDDTGKLARKALDRMLRAVPR